MGAANVGAVFINWPGHVSQRSLLVLLAMAHLSLDTERPEQRARRYFAGPGYLAEVLYGAAGIDRVDGGEAVPTDSAGRQVRKCLTELEKVGAIARVVKGAPGRRAEYEVVLFRPVDHRCPTCELDRSGPATEDRSGPEQRTAAVQNTGPQESPSGTTRNHQEHHQENTSSTHHVQTHETTTSSPHKGWSDVALITGPVTGDAYLAATKHLDRTVGTEHAGTLTAAYLVEHPDAGYMDAVVGVARQNGWTTP